jgi:hypothetical protein
MRRSIATPKATNRAADAGLDPVSTTAVEPTISEKRRSSRSSKAMCSSADAEPGHVEAASAGLTYTPKRRSKQKAQASANPADAELDPAPSCPAVGLTNRKRWSIRAAKAISVSADVEPRPGNTAGLTPLRKRRSIICAKANATAADVGRDQVSTSVAPTHSRIRRSSTRTKATGGSADVARHHDSVARTCFNDPLIITIRDEWRQRQSWHRSEKALTLAASAWCRQHVGVRGKNDKAGLKRAAELLERIEAGASGLDEEDIAYTVTPFLLARAPLEAERKKIEKSLRSLVRQLPIAQVIDEVPGFGELSLYSIIGEAGDLSCYRSHRGLWSRMGLAVIAGERQRKKINKDAADAHHYSPARRSTMWNVGNALIGYFGNGPRPLVGEDLNQPNGYSEWQLLFLHELRRFVENHPDERREPVGRKGQIFESYSKHAADHARRLTEKAFQVAAAEMD